MTVFRSWLNDWLFDVLVVVLGLIGGVVLLGIIVVGLVLAVPAHAAIPWTCAQVREAHRTLTQVEIEWIAKRYRLTKEQRAEAKACLKERK